jgi:L-lactate dehydrogenase complex protein LldF
VADPVKTAAAGSLRSRTSAATRDPAIRRGIPAAVDRFTEGRRLAMDDVRGSEELRQAARAIRTDIIARLPEVLTRFASAAAGAGAQLFWAANADEANSYVAALAERLQARSAVKGKSMATEEIDLNHALESAGVEVTETDLGEWIIQIAGQTPSHIIAPALHLNRHDVQGILNTRNNGGATLPADPDQLAAFARRMLRERFLRADLGITGCNFAVAESGSIVLVENEGNGRLTSTVPRVHVVLMGMERIVETWDQLDLMLNLLARSSTGQALTTYTNIITGPRRPGEGDGPDEVHIVILDNARSEILGSPEREILNCIRCGACLNVCPVYRQTGGHAYGSVYSGPVGAVLTPLMRPETGAELANASTLCGACMQACPVSIPIQDLLLSLRRRKAADAPLAERLSWRAWASTWSRPKGYRAAIGAAQLGRPLVRGAHILPGLGRWGQGRAMLKPARRSFQQLWDAGEV